MASTIFPISGGPIRAIASCLYVLICLSLLFSACQPASDKKAEEPQSPFFDLSRFFLDEIVRLDASKPLVQKTVSVNGQEEEQVSDSLSFQKELKAFLDTDINRTAWWDKYAIDSLYDNSHLQAIHYIAKTPDLKVKTIKISFQDEAIARVEIETSNESPTAHFEQMLVYVPDKRYMIETMQRIKFSQPIQMTVEVLFK